MRSPTPPLPCPRSKFTCGFLAWLVYTRFVLLVPINRIYEHLRRQNLGVPRSSLIRLIELGSDLAAAVDGVHWKQLKGIGSMNGSAGMPTPSL